MCWAGCHRLAAIAARLGLDDRAAYWTAAADPIGEAVVERAWNEERKAFTAAFGTDDRQFELRAERSGGGSGRVYTITYEAEDHSGNKTTRSVTVTVPKSQSSP